VRHSNGAAASGYQPDLPVVRLRLARAVDHPEFTALHRQLVDAAPSLRFTSRALEPGHHFVPAGTAELLRPENWPRLFGVPELGSR